VAYFQRRRVDKTDAGRVPASETLSIQEQRKQGATAQFHEPVVTYRGGKKVEKRGTDARLVIPFETAAAAEVEQDDDGHYPA
jgi:hypothetical protein